MGKLKVDLTFHGHGYNHESFMTLEVLDFEIIHGRVIMHLSSGGEEVNISVENIERLYLHG